MQALKDISVEGIANELGTMADCVKYQTCVQNIELGIRNIYTTTDLVCQLLIIRIAILSTNFHS